MPFNEKRGRKVTQASVDGQWHRGLVAAGSTFIRHVSIVIL